MGVVRKAVALLALLVPLIVAAPAGATISGTDVSHWNGAIDWLRVANGGFRFAYAKATEGKTLVDPTYSINRDGARTFGLRTGAYHFARPGGTSDASITANAIAQADEFVSVAQPAPGDLPPALDLEATGGLGPDALIGWTQAWLDEVVARTGAKPVIYASPNFWKTSFADTSTFASGGFRLWIAHWTKNAAPMLPAGAWGGSGWTFWQWTDCDAIPGFVHCADGDRFGGSDLGPVAIVAQPAAAPTVSAAPQVVGTPRQGTLLAAVPGSWNGARPLSFAYQWQSCDAAGGSCVAIPGATSETYTPTAADVGHALVATVTAQGSSGTGTSASAPTVAVGASGAAGIAAPAVTSTPTVSGTAQVGQTLTGSVGAWSGSPTSFALQWRRCDSSGASCAVIDGATSNQYVPTPGDVGATLSLMVTATGAGGSATAVSGATGAVVGAPVPQAAVGSAVAQSGAAGAVTTQAGAMTVTWQPGVVPVGATVSLAPVSPKLVLPGTAARLGVAPAAAPLPWPLDVAYASAPPDAVPGIASTGRAWDAIPMLSGPTLNGTATVGAYRDAGGVLHILTRGPGTFALFAKGKWGDPTRIAAGPPILEPISKKPRLVRRADGTVLFLDRLRVTSQSHLYASFGGPPILQKGSRLGWYLPGKRPVKTAQALQRTPGAVPVRLRLNARSLKGRKTLTLRVAAVDPYGRKASVVLTLRLG